MKGSEGRRPFRGRNHRPERQRTALAYTSLYRRARVRAPRCILRACPGPNAAASRLGSGPQSSPPPGEDARGRERFVRLSLLERGGLARGWFNVREARAEPRGEGIVAIAEGRLLSWRWLRLAEAQKLWSERQRTLAAL